MISVEKDLYNIVLWVAILFIFFFQRIIIVWKKEKEESIFLLVADNRKV